MTRPFSAALCALNAKYVHSSLAPWCLLAGVRAFAPDIDAYVVEGTVNEPPETVLERIASGAPDVVTFSCYLWNIRQTLALAEQLKHRLPGVCIALGGPEVSYCAERVLNENPAVDFVLSGEGETSVPALLSCLAQGKAPSAEEVPGLCTREYIAPPCVLSGEVPSPYTPEYFKALNGRIAYLETSRGCPFTCAFCLSGRCGAPRYFDLKGVYENILALANSGVQTVKLIDRTFNANPRHANAILRFLLSHYGREIPAGVCFHFEIAGDILTEETMELLAQMPAGAVQLEIGMQSFCEKTLEAVRRKTNTEKLKANIRRLVAMGNMHIHIDLIAGLPYEDVPTFAESFNTAYALGADMLQMGFLKLLHGAAMREEPQNFPCEFRSEPPYEVISTPWLTAEELEMLHGVEDALERMVNSGRFQRTADYLMECTGLTPFALFQAIGKAAHEAGVAGHGVALDEYTAFLLDTAPRLWENVTREALRDVMVCDRLESNATGRLPLCLHIADPALGQTVKRLAALNPPRPGVRRGVAILYTERQAVYVDYENKNPKTGRFALRRVGLDAL